MKQLFLYLARRDKSGIQLLSTFKADKEYKRTAISDLNQLSLPAALEAKLQKEIDSNKMLWEPMIESATNYRELKQNLRKRGYKNLPINPLPNFNIQIERITSEKKPVQKVQVRRTKDQPKMIRKRKD